MRIESSASWQRSTSSGGPRRRSDDAAPGLDLRLAVHRPEIVVFFADLRGFTAFSETAESEEVMDLLGESHGVVSVLSTDTRRAWATSPRTV